MCYDSARGEATRLLPEENVWFRDGWIGSEEGDDCVGVSGRNGGEEGSRVERAGVEEIRRFCGVRNVSNHRIRCDDWGADRDWWEAEYVLRPDLSV